MLLPKPSSRLLLITLKILLLYAFFSYDLALVSLPWPAPILLPNTSQAWTTLPCREERAMTLLP